MRDAMLPAASIDRPTPAPAESARAPHRWLKFGLIALIALACVYPFTLNFPDPDLWGHVRYGQDWLAAGALPRTATHTYTAVDYPWINHENAAELLFALSYAAVGVPGMLIAKCLLGIGILAAMAWTANRHQVSALATWTLLLLASTSMEAFFPLRPQLLSFAFCSLALVCLDRGFPEWPAQRQICFRWLWALPVIFIGWVNSHGGFVAGLCIVGAVLLGRLIELFASEGFSAWRKAAHLAAIGLACVAATAANPYGLGMHLWLWRTWGGAPPEISEWRPPMPDQPVFWPFVLLVAAGAASLAATRRRRDWTQIAILALVTWQASLHLRHIAFVALLAGFWLPVHWQSALMRLRPKAGNRRPIEAPAPWLRAALGLGIVVGIALQSVGLARRLASLPVLRSQYPVDALQFMADHRVTGKTVVAFNWSQYALAALAPEITVGFDGRFDTCYPQEAIDVHFDFLQGAGARRDRSPTAGAVDGRRALEYGAPDLVLTDRRCQPSVAVMRQETAREDSAWTLLYSDSLAELWGRRSRYDDPTSPHYLPPEQRRFDLLAPDATVQWPALPARRDAHNEFDRLTEH